jgi:hypothetical protein
MLGFENFEFITALLTNRKLIVDNVMAQVIHRFERSIQRLVKCW